MAYLKSATQFTQTLSADELREIYSYPHSRWLRVNFVSSIDGAATTGGLSGGLSGKEDKRIFGILRGLCDVVLVGAGTVRSENYGGVQVSSASSTLRKDRGQSPIPPIAMVSASGNIDPTSRVFTETEVNPIVLTREDIDSTTHSRLHDAGADVVLLPSGGASGVDLNAARHALADRGLTRILCEGGPSLFGELLAIDLVDELCLTTAPFLTAGTAVRIASHAHSLRHRMTLAHTLAGDDGSVFTRWVRDRTNDQAQIS
ncbi:pyrimidine reductase family protein [Hoyosella rhizosphaerae]|uniref:Bacterial bifunctional deaminase-reductase C-terminal domain-containing protein n=1 Tax=Hoyosella rhizosphaerae TaxID=1755582 RepID=A0A916U3W1_9ACTN|nr:pyrimidine reductase family protein [Hoyosella rhizosphaerae]MBN4926401.1 pyrimidine reductase family protein [Hoyosella rhizosphaerae]GGC59667.1 hypothetical protein GCM10011410_10120 [Hoyosella rhizosphaerae]